ncbi:MAG TPA: glycosyltransferase [Aggregatilineales bacterium]|nr:glycosyltransferase [Aggregatilineales bacterium]
MTALLVFSLIAFAALTYVTLVATMNVFAFPRVGARPTALASAPRVSVLIPARNEARVIANTVRAHLAQDYPDFEVLVLDDHSDDSTGDIARAAGDDRLTVHAGQPLPPGWLGKNWACQQLADQAGGDLLLFTDADVRWEPGALAALVSELQRTRADLLTVWPTQITRTWSERLTVPLMALVVVGYLPIIGTHTVPHPAFAAANGQCMLWRREAYLRAGGHEAVRNRIVEDVALARRVKASKMHLIMEDGGGLIACRMYHNWPEVRDGYAKNILHGHGGLIPLLLSTVLHWLMLLYPWLLAVIAIMSGDRLLLAWAAALIALGVLVRMLTAAVTRQRLLDALLLPASALVMTVIAFRAIYWQFTGGPRWKGRTVGKVT